MFGPRHYVPILRWKQGERLALRALRRGDRDWLTPLIEIPRKMFEAPKKQENQGADAPECERRISEGPAAIQGSGSSHDSEERLARMEATSEGAFEEAAEFLRLHGAVGTFVYPTVNDRQVNPTPAVQNPEFFDDCRVRVGRVVKPEVPF